MVGTPSGSEPLGGFIASHFCPSWYFHSGIPNPGVLPLL